MELATSIATLSCTPKATGTTSGHFRRVMLIYSTKAERDRVGPGPGPGPADQPQSSPPGPPSSWLGRGQRLQHRQSHSNNGYRPAVWINHYPHGRPCTTANMREQQANPGDARPVDVHRNKRHSLNLRDLFVGFAGFDGNARVDSLPISGAAGVMGYVHNAGDSWCGISQRLSSGRTEAGPTCGGLTSAATAWTT